MGGWARQTDRQTEADRQKQREADKQACWQRPTEIDKEASQKKTS